MRYILTGYDTEKCCDRCGAKPAKIEPRFGYARCIDCDKIPPIDFFKEDNLNDLEYRHQKS